MSKTAFKKNDIIKIKAAFLKSAGWYTNVPKNGRVEGVEELSPGGTVLLDVTWSDGARSKINAANVMLDGKPDYSGV